MGADRKLDAHGPVGLHPVGIVHALGFGLHEIDRLTHFLGQLVEQLVAADFLMDA